MMSKMGFWQRQKGFANAGQGETLYIGWLGSLPGGIAKFRQGCSLIAVICPWTRNQSGTTLVNVQGSVVFVCSFNVFQWFQVVFYLSLYIGVLLHH